MNIQHEKRRVSVNNSRAKRAGLEASLTLAEWLQTIEDNSGLCHYCKVKPFEEMDHVIPIIRGGGTTKDNCVPSCAECNSKQFNPKYGTGQRYRPSIARGATPQKAIKLADSVSFPAHRKFNK